MNRWLTIIFSTAFLTFLLASQAFAQKTLTIKKELPGAILVDEIGIQSGEVRSGRFDTFFAELSKLPNSTGYVFVDCGKTCQYGEVEAHLRGIEVKIGFRRFDRSRLVVLNGGYRESLTTELWLVSAGASPPTSRSTLNIKDVTFKGLRRSMFEPYDCCDDPVEVWNQLKKN